MLTSSSSFALIGHRTLELYYFILLLLFYLFILFFIIIFFNLTVVRGRRSSEDGLKMEEKTQVPEVGFEPGTFRSCVDHSNHYATDTPPIPDVLLVLVAPKHINRNVTTTLQSRFTPNPHPTGHTLELFLFYYYYYYFFLFFFIFYYFFFYYYYYYYYFFFLNTSHSSPPTIFPISTPTRTLHRHHLPYLHPNPHCSPKFGLYRFFNIFLRNPYLLTWLIWGRTFQPLLLLLSVKQKKLYFVKVTMSRLNRDFQWAIRDKQSLLRARFLHLL